MEALRGQDPPGRARHEEHDDMSTNLLECLQVECLWPPVLPEGEEAEEALPLALAPPGGTVVDRAPQNIFCP